MEYPIKNMVRKLRLIVKPLEKELVKERLNQELPKYKRPQIYLEAETLSLTCNPKTIQKRIRAKHLKESI
ncbi:hypothetical protein [Lactococcus cremoris]|uniref:hypothetical protein n=1 Tax=Lactococcus lactis subsp. cremoris TaxID=1359 RepID=UPI00290A2215|nr:hypothetical protein [Lactococcus cremoris]MDU8931634.1 hypothetical protein [Lactococcus cremoris]